MHHFFPVGGSINFFVCIFKPKGLFEKLGLIVKEKLGDVQCRINNLFEIAKSQNLTPLSPDVIVKRALALIGTEIQVQ